MIFCLYQITEAIPHDEGYFFAIHDMVVELGDPLELTEEDCYNEYPDWINPL